MKAPDTAGLEKVFSGPAGYALVLVAAGVVVWLLWNKAKAAGQAVLNVNAGTPYAGAGVAGTLGNLTNQASGGVLSNIGEWLGGSIYDWTHAAYDPNAVTADKNTPNVGGSTIATSPVQQNPAVLPYSYKQAVIDTPTLLGTDRLFTPNALSGAAGYIDAGQQSLASGPLSTYYSPVLN